jgi:hypothetical protein
LGEIKQQQLDYGVTFYENRVMWKKFSHITLFSYRRKDVRYKNDNQRRTFEDEGTVF